MMNYLKWRPRKLTQKGITHIALPLAIIGIAVLGGVFTQVASNANSLNGTAEATGASSKKKRSILHVAKFTMTKLALDMDTEVQTAQSQPVTKADCQGYVDWSITRKLAQSPEFTSSLPVEWDGMGCKAKYTESKGFSDGTYKIKMRYTGSDTLRPYRHSSFKRFIGTKPSKPAKPASTTKPSTDCVGALC